MFITSWRGCGRNRRGLKWLRPLTQVLGRVIEESHGNSLKIADLMRDI